MAFIAGKNTLSSGTGSWTIVTPASDTTIAIDDPDTRNPILAGGTPVPQADFAFFPTVQLVVTLTADGTTTMQIIGDDSTEQPDPPDSIGFTANMQISVVNDTGHALSGLTFNLTNDNPDLPYNNGSSVIDYGEKDFDANYAYFTMIQPVDGEAITLFTPTGAATTAAGAAPSEMVLTGNIAAGDTVTSDMVMHNTELMTVPDNNFDLSITDSPATVTPPPPPPPPPPPVTLPAIASILFQSIDGDVAQWQVNGASLVGGELTGSNTGPTWHAKGTYNDSILWQNDDGSIALWQMNAGDTAVVGGAVVTSGGVVANPGPTWHVEGAGDFYGDGNTAVLWQNDDGAVALWDLSGSTVIGGAVVANPGPSWHIEGNADFYGDGHQDILWQNDNGAVALWDMSGTGIVAAAVVANPGPTWHIKGTGDFYGDGHQAILFQNDNGSVALWDMSGSSVIAAAVVGSAPGPAWHVEGTGDYNGDGRTDVLFQNDNGSVAIWEMNGTNISGGGLVGDPGPSWGLANDQMQFIQGTSAPNLTASAVSQDEFVFNNVAGGAHSITGFNPVQDMIEFSAAQFPTFAAVEAATTAVAGGSVINLGNGGSLSLPGITPTALNAHNFALTS